MSYACRLANRGYTVEQIADELSGKRSGKRQRGSVKYRRIFETKGIDAADRYARRTAEKAVSWILAHPKILDRNEAVLRVLEIEATADALPWGVYGGADLRRNLQAAFVVARRVGGVRFGLSLREHAGIAGQDLSQTRANRNALHDLGWLRRNSRDRPGRTSRFGLRTPSHIQPTGEGGLNVQGAGGRYLSHDAFRPDALGDAGWYVLASAAVPIGRRELALRTGYDEETLLDHLARMEHLGLMCLTDSGLVSHAIDDLGPLLDAAATLFSTSGALDADNARYKRDRELFRSRLDVNVRKEAEPSAWR